MQNLKWFLGVIFALGMMSAMAQGETCATAEFITQNGSFQADGPSSGNGCVYCAGSTHADWYTFSSPTSGILNISSCSFFGPKTRLYLYKGSCQSLELVAQDSTGCGFGNGSNIFNYITDPGTNYFLEWDNLYSDEGFDFDFSYDPIVGCQEPLGVNVDSVSHDYARIAWTSANAPSEFGLEYGPFGIAPGEGTVITGNVNFNAASVEITGLETDTRYTYYLWELCNGLPSDTVSGNFRTDETCPAPFSFFFFADSVSYDYARIEWTSLNDDAVFHLGYGEAPLDEQSMTVVTGTVGIDGPPVELMGLTANTQYDYIYWEVCTTGPGDTVSGMNFTTSSLCDSPFFFQAQETSGTTAVLNWVTPNTVGTYTIEYGPQGFDIGTGLVEQGPIGSQPVTLTGLNPNGIYDAYLWETCENGFNSDTLGPVIFDTFTGAPQNDSCFQAITVQCGEVHATNTNFATAGDTPMENCVFQAQGPGVWYTLEGNDSKVTLSLCESSFDTQVQVFVGSCESYNCVAANDDGPNCEAFQSEVNFDALSGLSYYIFIGGFEEATGNVVMEVSCSEICEPKPENDNCSQAYDMALEIQDCVPMSFSNMCALPAGSNNPCNEFGTLSDVWFKVNTGDQLGFELVLNYDPSLGVLGVALHTACEGGYLGCGEVESGVPTQIDGLEMETDYYIQLWTELGFEGSFDFCIQKLEPEGIFESSIEREWSVFPNPANGEVHVLGVEGQEVVIYDLSGRVVLNNTIDNGLLDVSRLNAGLYIMKTPGYKSLTLMVEE